MTVHIASTASLPSKRRQDNALVLLDVLLAVLTFLTPRCTTKFIDLIN